MELAVRKRDINLARFLLQTDQATRSPDENNWTPNASSKEDFYLALDKGFLEVAGEMILSNGVALPLHELIEQSGEKEEEKSKVSLSFLFLIVCEAAVRSGSLDCYRKSFA